MLKKAETLISLAKHCMQSYALANGWWAMLNSTQNALLCLDPSADQFSTLTHCTHNKQSF